MSTAVATPPTFATGRLGRRQIAALERHAGRLGDDGACRVLLLHHPPVATMTDYRRRLVDSDELEAVLRHRPVELVLCGHQHIFQLGALPSAAASIPVVGAPSASLHGGDRHHEGGYIVYDLVRGRRRLGDRSRAAAIRSGDGWLRTGVQATAPTGTRTAAVRLEAAG